MNMGWRDTWYAVIGFVSHFLAVGCLLLGVGRAGIGFVSHCRGRSGVVEKGSRGEDKRRSGEEIGFVSFV